MSYSVGLATAATQNEGTAPSTPGAVFTFNLTRGASDASFDGDNVSFRIVQVDGSGNIIAGSTNDFASSNGVGFVPGTGAGAIAAWGAGGLTNTLTITADPDSVAEPTENFQVWIYRNVDPGHPFYTGAITLTNDDASAGPVFSSPNAFSLAENTTTVGTVAASGLGATTYAFAGGADDGDFTLNTTTGVLAFAAAPDFEAPAGHGGSGGNAYLVDINATAGGQTTLQHVTVNVSNVDDLAPTITAGSTTANVAENTQAVTLATPLAAHTDAASTATTWSIAGGADAGTFTIDPNTGALSFTTAPNYEADAGHGATVHDYVVQVKATDSAGLSSAAQTETISVTNVVEGPVITSSGGAAFVIVHTPENDAPTSTILTEAATKDDAGTSATFSLSGADAGLMHIDAATGAVNFVTSPDYEFPADSDHDNVYQFTVTASTGHGPASTQAVYLFVDNVVEPGDPVVTPPSGGGTTFPPTGPQVINGTDSSESLIASSTGNDSIYGGAGDDSIDGGSGANSIVGGDGDDVVRGFDGNDTIDGGTGNDDVNGNVGDDSVYGGDGADTVRGGQGNDTVDGGAGNDPHVNGNLGNDIVHGGDGNDTVYGGQGNDTVYGDAGNDLISGDLGNDILFGGPGADGFAFAKGGGQDWVGDFNAAEGDHIVLPTGTAYTVTSYLGQVVIDLGGGDTIGLAGIPSASFSSTWITFS